MVWNYTSGRISSSKIIFRGVLIESNINFFSNYNKIYTYNIGHNVFYLQNYSTNELLNFNEYHYVNHLLEKVFIF